MEDKVEVDIIFPNQTRYLGLIGRIGEDLVHSLGRYPGDREVLAYELNLVLTEAISNVISHANENDPNKQIQIQISATNDALTIKVFDEGDGFDFAGMVTDDMRETDECGRGIHIMRCLMDQVSYRRTKKRNVLEMIKNLH
ncbi:ATP-binding protein [Geopsychrobacter electrodiphilus]|uniref:ATP-binding protein n=1 Tax=Geopsychrobacter electrodiphilus TaxID=225196 RepID=UPI00036C9F49|nr:ATP-binding protein [Geopsychrobacter electrodiphilus]